MDTIASHRPQRNAVVKNVPAASETRGARQQAGSRRSERVYGSLAYNDSSDPSHRSHHVNPSAKHASSAKSSHAAHEQALIYTDDLLRSLQQMWEVPYLCHMLHRFRDLIQLPTLALADFEHKLVTGEDNLIMVSLRRLVEMLASLESPPLDVTSKNWYRLLVKITKEHPNLLYWPSSPIEDGALKSLPVNEQVMLFRVILDMWLLKAGQVDAETVTHVPSDSNSFHLLGHDDKGDVYWQYSNRLYREELFEESKPEVASDEPAIAAQDETLTEPSSGTAASASEEVSTPRSTRQKHKRERMAVLNEDSLSFLKRSGGSDTTTRSTRNSQYRTLPNEFSLDKPTTNEGDAHDSPQISPSNHKRTQATTRSGRPISPSATSAHYTSSIATRSKSPRHQNANNHLDPNLLHPPHASQPALPPTPERIPYNATNFETHTGVPYRWIGTIPRITTVALDQASVEALVFILSTGNSQTMRDLVLTINDRMITHETQKTQNTVESASHTESTVQNAIKQETNDQEEVKPDSSEVKAEVKPEAEKLSSSIVSESDGSLVASKEVKQENANSMEVDEASDESVEDSVINALMGAAAASESASSASDQASGHAKIDGSNKMDVTALDSASIADAPRQKRQAAVKSRNYLTNGLDPLMEYESPGSAYGSRTNQPLNGAINERKRARSSTPPADELTLRIRLTPQVKKWFKMHQHEDQEEEYREEPVRKKIYKPPVSVSAPSSSHHSHDRHSHMGLGSTHMGHANHHHTSHNSSSSAAAQLAAAASSHLPSTNASGRVTRSSTAESLLANLEEEVLSVLSPSLSLSSQASASHMSPKNAHSHMSRDSGNNHSAPAAPSLSNINLGSQFGYGPSMGASSLVNASALGSAALSSAALNASALNASSLNPLAALYGSPYTAYNPLTGGYSTIDPVTILQYNQLIAAQAAAAAAVSPQDYLLQQRQQLYQQQLLEAHLLQQQQVMFQQRYLAQQQQVAQQYAQQQAAAAAALSQHNQANMVANANDAMAAMLGASATEAEEKETAQTHLPTAVEEPTSSPNNDTEQEIQIKQQTMLENNSEPKETESKGDVQETGPSTAETAAASVSSTANTSQMDVDVPSNTQATPEADSTAEQKDDFSSPDQAPSEPQTSPQNSNTEALLLAALDSSEDESDEKKPEPPVVTSTEPTADIQPQDNTNETTPTPSSSNDTFGLLSSLAGAALTSPAPTALQSPFDVAISH